MHHIETIANTSCVHTATLQPASVAPIIHEETVYPVLPQVSQRVTQKTGQNLYQVVKLVRE